LLGGLGAFLGGVLAILLPYIDFLGLTFWIFVLIGFSVGAMIGFFGVLGERDVAFNVRTQDDKEGE
jgi:hypothetical protein